MAETKFENPFGKDPKYDSPFGEPKSGEEDSKKSPEEGPLKSTIKSFEESGDFLLGVFAGELKTLRLNNENIITLHGLIQRLSNAKNKEEITVIMTELRAARRLYDDGVKEATEAAKKGEKEVKEDTGNWYDLDGPVAWVKGTFWSSEDVAKIEAISIDGKVDSIAQFIEKINALKLVMQGSDVFKGLDPKEQASVIAFLDTLPKSFKEEETKNAEFVNSAIDSLAVQVDKQPEGVVSLELGGDESIDFSSKQEAYEFITFLKSEAESEIQSFLENSAENIGSILSFGLYHGFDYITKPYQYYGDKIKETGKDIWEGEHWAETYIWNGVGIIIGGFATINYTETLYRRVVQDTLGKFGVKRFVFENFDRRQMTFRPDEGGAEKQAEFNNRLDAYRSLQELGAMKTGEEKIAFDKELDKILDHMRINTSTFWLKVRALRNDRGMVGRYYYAFKYGPNYTPFNVNQQEQSLVNANNEENQIKLKKDLGFVFEKPKFETTENGRIERVNSSGESENIEQIKNYINSRNDLSDSEKKSRIKRIDDFLNFLETHPRGESFIKAELIAIAKEGQLPTDGIKARLEKKYPFLEARSDDGKKLTLGEQWSNIKGAMVQMYGENAPASYTKSHALAFRFLSMVESGQWSGNEAQLDKIFSLIDSGKLEISHIYKFSLVNPLRHFNFIRSMFGRYGLRSPELSRLRSVSEGYSNKDLKDILDKGKSFDEELKKLQKILLTGVDIDGRRYTPVQAIENYIKYDISNSEEARLKPVFEDLKKLINDGKILITPTELYQELQRIKDGFIPSPLLLGKLEKIQADERAALEAQESTEKASLFEKIKLFEFSLRDRPEIPESTKESISTNLKQIVSVLRNTNYLQFSSLNSMQTQVNTHLENIIKHNIGGHLKDLLLSIRRSVQRVSDIQVQRVRAATPTPPVTPTVTRTDVDSFIEEAKKGNLNITEAQVAEIKDGTLRYDEKGPFIAGEYTEKDGEDFVKRSEKFQELHKYDLRTSLGIGESATVPDIERKLGERYVAEVELANLYDIANERPLVIGNEIKFFSRAIDKNDFTRGQAREVLEELFIKGETFSGIDMDTIIHSTTDNETEFNKVDDLKTALRNKYNDLNPDKQKILRTAIADRGVDTSILPQIIQDDIAREVKEKAIGPETERKVRAAKRDIGDFRARLAGTTTPEGLTGVHAEFNTYLRDNGLRGIPELEADIRLLTGDYEGANTRITVEVEAVEEENRTANEANEAAKIDAELQTHKDTLGIKLASLNRKGSIDALSTAYDDFEKYIIDNKLAGKDGITDIQVKFQEAYEAKTLAIENSTPEGRERLEDQRLSQGRVIVLEVLDQIEAEVETQYKGDALDQQKQRFPNERERILSNSGMLELEKKASLTDKSALVAYYRLQYKITGTPAKGATGGETASTNKEGYTSYDQVKKYLDDIYPSILMSGDEDAIQKIQEEFSKINDGGSTYLDDVLAKTSVVSYFKKEVFAGVDVLKSSSIGTLSQIKTKLVEIDSKFSGLSQFSDLGPLIDSLTDTDVRRNAIQALKDIRASK